MTKVPTPKIIKVACSDVKYLVRCGCRTVLGYSDRSACTVHGPKQPALYHSGRTVDMQKVAA